MIVVFGPKQYGKENIQNRYGFCEQCGAHGLLSSYDTSEFFTIYYIPLIPMGRKRILDACPACKMHREARLKDYRKRRDRALHDAVEGMKEAPQDGDKAMEAVQAYVYFGAKQDFMTMAPVLAEKHGGHPGLQGTVGAGFEYYGDAPAAERYYRQALTLDDSAENREALAVNLLYQARPDEARALMEHVLTGNEKEKAGLLYVLADGYREQGRHAEALQMLDAVERLDPDAQGDTEHQRLRTLSEAAGAEATPVASQMGRPREASDQRGVPTIIPRMVPLSLVLLILGGYLFLAWQKGANPEVWVVSGTSTPYTVTVNDQTLKMRPFDVHPVRLREGRWDVAVTDTPFPVEPFEVRHRTSFFTRPFRNPVVVLNPDGLAVLVQETTIYSVSPDPDGVNEFELSSGDTLYRFSGIDDPFSEFPEEISLSSNSSRARRSKLYVLEPGEEARLLRVALGVVPPDELCAYLKRRIRMEPHDLVSLSFMNAMCAGQDPSAHVETLREGMALRPVLIDWHRMYQEAMETYRPEHDLASEYRALMEAEPEVAAFKYLLGRVLPDREEATRLFLASEDTEDPSGYGFYAVAYMNMCSGNFSGAVTMAEQAVEADPDHLQFGTVLNEIQLALGRYEELLADVRVQMQDAPPDAALAEMETRFLTLLGRSDEAEEAGQRFLKAAEPLMSASEVDGWRHYLAAVRYQAEGDAAAHLEHLKKAGFPDTAFQIALLSMDLDAAMLALKKEGADAVPFTSHLLAYGVAMKLDRPVEAQTLLAQALEQLEAGNLESRSAAAMLRGEQPPEEDLKYLLMRSGEKSVLAAALGLTHPDAREVCFEIAELHNFQPGFPQGVVRLLTE